MRTVSLVVYELLRVAAAALPSGGIVHVGDFACSLAVLRVIVDAGGQQISDYDRAHGTHRFCGGHRTCIDKNRDMCQDLPFHSAFARLRSAATRGRNLGLTKESKAERRACGHGGSASSQADRRTG